MKKYWIIIALFAGMTFNGFTQTYVTKNGMIRFYSEAPMEKIEATTRQANSALINPSGDFVFKVLIKSFTFEKAMMQSHFNENYMESDKYPEATFVGKITNIQEINTKKDGTYTVTVKGKLTMHGQTKEIKEIGTIDIKGDSMEAKAKFNILLADYNIVVPNTLINNISKSIEITVDAALDIYKQ
jgi:hypothetical protein